MLDDAEACLQANVSITRREANRSRLDRIRISGIVMTFRQDPVLEQSGSVPDDH